MESSCASHSYWILKICTRHRSSNNLVTIEYVRGIAELSNTTMCFKKILEVIPERPGRLKRTQHGLLFVAII